MKSKFKNLTTSFLLILILSFLLAGVSFFFVDVDYNFNDIKPFLENTKLFVLNFLPILITMLVLFSITGKLSASFLITTVAVFAIGITNTTKLVYRDEPFRFADIFLAGEAKDMVEANFKIQWPDWLGSAAIIVLAVFFVLLYLDKDMKKVFTRNMFMHLVALNLFFSVIMSQVIFSKENYKSTSIEGYNKWLESEIVKSKGMIYPFTYSIKNMFETAPKDYSKKAVDEILKDYKGAPIPTDKRVNIVAVMLESFNDLSKFDGVNFKENPYEYYNLVKEESIHGNLVVNIFGGGTINTERSFISSMYKPPRYESPQNSIVRYLKENDYYTEAFHPNTGKFYNRTETNKNVGFDKFWCDENMFEGVVKKGEILPDEILKDYMIKGFVDNKKTGKPYFGFTVTMQNHGPYYFYEPHKYYYDNIYNVEEKYYYTTNNYLRGIEKTSKFMYDLTEYFKNESAPTVLVFFGDHNPSLGPNDEGFKSLGIDMVSDNIDSFLAKYQTPYIIWANGSAKEVLGKDFVGEGPDISAMNLAPYLFKELSFPGDDVMQFKKEMMETVPVYTNSFVKVCGEYCATDELDEGVEREIKFVDYYYRNTTKDLFAR